MIKQLLVILAASCGILAGAGITFSDAEIVLAPKPTSVAWTAAAELQYHLQKMTGGKFPIVHKRTAKYQNAIYVGAQDAFQKAGMPLAKVGQDGFLRGVKGKDLYIAGDDDAVYGRRSFHDIYFTIWNRGTMHGAYDFLESQGVVWPIPGKENEYIPRKKTITVPAGVKIDNPVFIERGANGIWNFKKFPDGKEFTKNPGEATVWAMRVRVSNVRGIASGCHSERYLGLAKMWFKKHPERFQMMKNGKRNPKYSCWSDPAIKEVWLKAADAFFSGKSPASVGMPHLKTWVGFNVKNEFIIDPDDHSRTNDGRCRCKRCNEFRKKHPGHDDTELYWQTIAYVAKNLEKKHPGKYITTLVYPPKTGFPKTVKLPSNIRVRICQGGIKNMLIPAGLKANLDQINTWGKVVGAKNLPLWTYQFENFGRKLPGVPEIYPYLAADYLRTMSGKIAGMRNEFTDPLFLPRFPDLYIQAKLLWNPNQEVKTLLKDFFKAMYGPAAGVMGEISQTFENNFRKYYTAVTPNVSNPKTLGLVRDGKWLRNYAWSKIYTVKEMDRISAMIDKAEKLAAGQAPYAKRVKLFRKWVWDVAKSERREVMQMADMIPTLTLNKGKWSPEQKLVSAERLVKEIKNPVSFRMKYDDKNLYISVKASEKEANKLRINPKAALEDIWRDDTVEFFLYTPSNRTLRQAIFSTANRCAVQYVAAKKHAWKKWPGLKFTMKSDAKQRTVEIVLPMDSEMKKGFRFNLVRSRKLKNVRGDEAYTWSEAAGLGNWFVTDSYGKIIRK